MESVLQNIIKQRAEASVEKKSITCNMIIVSILKIITVTGIVSFFILVPNKKEIFLKILTFFT